MKKSTISFLCALVASLTAMSSSEAATPQTVSLSAIPQGEAVEWVVAKGDYTLTLTDAMPSATYWVTVDYTYQEIPGPPQLPAVAAIAGAADCDSKVAALKARLLSAGSEDEVRIAASEALADSASSCEPRLQSLVKVLTHRLVSPDVKVVSKYLSVVHVKRLSPSGEQKTWEIKLSTGPAGAWVSMPILTAVQDRGEKWFSKSDPVTNDDGTMQERYRLIREDRGFDLRPGAGVGFLYVPASQRDNPNVSWAFLTGLGVTDSATPLLFMSGVSALIGDHVSVSLGVAGTWERQLLGRYRGVEFVDDNLSNDQLTDENLVVRPFFSIGLDFNGFDITAGGKKPKPPDK